MRTAVVLFNLGAPDHPEAVKPFLFNLFYDKYIIRLPNPLRYGLAKLIASRREKEAQKIYATLGGGSPLLKNTQTQAQALEAALGQEYKTFIAMRYWHPFIGEAVEAVKNNDPDRIVLLPLYPQYSTTTTQSSFLTWREESKVKGLDKITKEICCYPIFEAFIDQIVAQIQDFWENIDLSKTRFLFSAHGLPEKIIKAGDPYQYQVEQSVQEILKKLPKKIDYRICYQSRVGPLKWIEPSTENEIVQAGLDQKNIVVIPISFVSEHAETLVELDQVYREHAMKNGIKKYDRLLTVDTQPIFIEGLKNLVIQAFDDYKKNNRFLCPATYCGCWERKCETYGRTPY